MAPSPPKEFLPFNTGAISGEGITLSVAKDWLETHDKLLSLIDLGFLSTFVMIPFITLFIISSI